MLFESFFRSIFALLEAECHCFLISNLAWYTLYNFISKFFVIFASMFLFSKPISSSYVSQYIHSHPWFPFIAIRSFFMCCHGNSIMIVMSILLLYHVIDYVWVILFINTIPVFLPQFVSSSLTTLLCKKRLKDYFFFPISVCKYGNIFLNNEGLHFFT